MSTEPTWHDIGAFDDLAEGDITGRTVAGREIAVYRIGDEAFATAAICTHGNANLCGGFVEADGSIECPLHQGRFDIRSGRALCEPVEVDLATYAVSIDGGRVRVRA